MTYSPFRHSGHIGSKTFWTLFLFLGLGVSFLVFYRFFFEPDRTKFCRIRIQKVYETVATAVIRFDQLSDKRINDASSDNTQKDRGERLYIIGCGFALHPGDPASDKNAREAFEAASNLGNAAAMYEMSVYLRLGIGGPPNNLEALNYCRAAIAHGYGAAYEFLFDQMELTQAQGTLSEVQLEVVKRLAHQGNASAIFLLGQIALHSHFTNSLNLALEYFQQAADLGSAEGSIAMARFYLSGAFKPRNANERARLCCLSVLILGANENDPRVQVDIDSASNKAESISTTLAQTLLFDEKCGHSRASFCMAKLLHAHSQLTDTDTPFMERHASRGLQSGEKQCTGYLALAAYERGQKDLASRLLDQGVQQSDWRCIFARQLITAHVAEIQPAIEQSLALDFIDYESYNLSRQSHGKSVAPIPLYMHPPEIPISLGISAPRGRHLHLYDLQ